MFDAIMNFKKDEVQKLIDKLGIIIPVEHQVHYKTVILHDNYVFYNYTVY